MTAEELRSRIEKEIAGNWDRTNGHQCDLRRCLVTPALQVFEDLNDPSASVELWTVLEEHPVIGDGYKVVFDERSGMFGLACRFLSGRHGYLGPYDDTFLTAFDAM